MNSWILQDFFYGDIYCQLIDFSVQGNQYVIIFNKIDSIRDDALIGEKSDELGIDYRENSYEVKFDLRENFQSGRFFDRPQQSLSLLGLKELGFIIKELLVFHHANSAAEFYVCVAENNKLKRFYDRLITRYAQKHGFSVRTNLGCEGLGYEIRTKSYKSKNGKN